MLFTELLYKLINCLPSITFNNIFYGYYIDPMIVLLRKLLFIIYAYYKDSIIYVFNFLIRHFDIFNYQILIK